MPKLLETKPAGRKQAENISRQNAAGSGAAAWEQTFTAAGIFHSGVSRPTSSRQPNLLYRANPDYRQPTPSFRFNRPIPHAALFFHAGQLFQFSSLISRLDRAMRRITAFNVSEENPYYTSYEGILYSKDGKKVIKSPAKKRGSVKLHDGTEDICENAFAFSDIQSVTFPDSLKRIERSAFDSCYALTEIDFGNGIEHLGENEDGYIFNSCDSLEVLRFPKQLKSIGKSAFAKHRLPQFFNEAGSSTFSRWLP